MHWGSLINDQEKDKLEEMEQWWKDRFVCLRVYDEDCHLLLS